jgi:Single-strand binding protein family
MNKSVNKVFLVGRLTRNPELRHTTTNKAVCAFGLATNRARKTRQVAKSNLHWASRIHQLVLQCSRSNKAAIKSRKPPMIASLSSLSSAKLAETEGFYFLAGVKQDKKSTEPARPGALCEDKALRS